MENIWFFFRFSSLLLQSLVIGSWAKQNPEAAMAQTCDEAFVTAERQLDFGHFRNPAFVGLLEPQQPLVTF
jgi:hypothetical protein